MPLHTFLVPTCIFGPVYRTEPVYRRDRNPDPDRNTVRFGKSVQKDPWVPRNRLSGVSGTWNADMKLSFGLAPSNGDLSPSVPETPEPYFFFENGEW